jgi:tetratricopeptide (TPR) repeat protein
LSDFPAARAAIQQATTAAQTDAERASALALLGEMESNLGNYPEAQLILSQAVPLARSSGDRLTLCRALYALGDVDWRLGKLDEARVVLDESLELARALGDVTRELFALNRLGVLYLQLDLSEAEQYFAEVHKRSVAVGNRERAASALNNLGVAAVDRLDYAAARDYFREALVLGREMGAQQAIALYINNLAESNIKLGELSAARAELREGLALALRIGATPWIVSAVKDFALLAFVEGRTERALELMGLARRQPAWSSDFQRELDSTLPIWGLDPASAEERLSQKSAALDWDETVQGLLQD